MKKQVNCIIAVLLSAIIFILAGCTPTENPKTNSTPNEKETSVEFTSKMTIGWNLGNAFDANGFSEWDYKNGLSMEYNWLPHKQPTSRMLIKTVKEAGFNTIRIPVSWHNHMSQNTTTFQIDSAWMNRVKEVVDWALAEDMFVIINIHHDNLTETEIASNPGFCLSTNADIQNKSKTYIEKVWTQIADTFKDYDNRLVFELLNEPRCIGTAWEWGFWGNNASKAKTYCDIITNYEQVALNVIRSSGSKNVTRFVMAPGYAAATSNLNSYTLPTDTTTDKLILATHAYTPSNFALTGDEYDYDSNKSSIESQIDYLFTDLANNYVKKGIGVVMGEASASDKNNTSSREKWASYYFTKAKAAGIPVVLWDNEIVAPNSSDRGGENHGYFNRETCEQYFPTILKVMMKAVYGNDFTPKQ